MAELSHAHNQHAQFNTAQPHAAALHAAPYDMAADTTMCPALRSAPCSAPAPQQHGDKTAAFEADATFASATPNQPAQAQQPAQANQPQQPQSSQQPQQPQDDTAERLRVAIGQTLSLIHI